MREVNKEGMPRKVLPPTTLVLNLVTVHSIISEKMSMLVYHRYTYPDTTDDRYTDLLYHT